MQDINKPNRSNIGGVLRFNFVDVKDVLSIPIPVNSVISQAVSLKPGKQWYKGYGTIGTIGYSEPSEIINAGTVYHRLFVAFCPHDNAGNTHLFNEMRNKQFLIDSLDNNGLRKLIGSLEEPLSFSDLLNTKVNVPELPGSAISFYGDGSHKSYVYDI